MRYADYRDAIHAELRRHAAGLTWTQLQSRLGLPYNRPCPTWTRQLESEIGLRRRKGDGRSLVWHLGTGVVGRQSIANEKLTCNARRSD
jgi:hypothetical protein